MESAIKFNFFLNPTALLVTDRQHDMTITKVPVSEAFITGNKLKG